MQNYHFALGGNILGLISKNYYGLIYTWISWIHSLYDNLTKFQTWNNIFLSKAIKLWKLVTGATSLKIYMQRYRGEARDGGYEMKSLQAVANG